MKNTGIRNKTGVIALALILTLGAVWVPGISVQGAYWSGLHESTLTTVSGQMVICENAALWIWGEGRLHPERFMENVAAVSVGTTAGAWGGAGHTMVVRTDGSLWGWGNNSHGQLGDGTTIYRQSPVHIMNDIKTVLAGYSHTLAIGTDGTLWSWGSNHSGQIGDGTRTFNDWVFQNDRWDVIPHSNDRHTPVRVMDNIQQVMSVHWGSWHDMSGSSVFALGTDGSLWSWGANQWDGSLGDGTLPDWDDYHRPFPVQIMSDVVYMTTCTYSMFAIQSNGDLWAWGRNNNGQLGDGTYTNRNRPVWIMGNVSTVASRGGRTMAITADGILWAWGSNTNGRLGDGTYTVHSGWWDEHLWIWIDTSIHNDRHSPIQIMDHVAYISLSPSHALAIRTDGSLWAWGSNRRGLLGDGTQTVVELHEWQGDAGAGWGQWEETLFSNDRHSPILIMENVAAAFAFNTHSMAIRPDGSLWAWGDNTGGQLGDGTTTLSELIWDYINYCDCCGEWLIDKTGRHIIVQNNDRHSPVLIKQRVMLPSGPAPGPAEPYVPEPEPPTEPYIPEPEAPAETFTPPRNLLNSVTDPASAQSAITQTLDRLTPGQRDSAEALNTVTLLIENIIRRGTTETLSGDLSINADLLQDMANTAQILRETTAMEDIRLPQTPAIYLNILSDQPETVTITFPEDVHFIAFDGITIETDFATFTVSRNDIEQGSEITISYARVEIPTIPAETPPPWQGSPRPAQGQGVSPLNLLRNFWAVIAIILLLLLWFVLARFGKKFRLWVVPTFTVLFLAANAFTFFILGDDNGPTYIRNGIFAFEEAETPPEPIMTGFSDAVTVSLTEGMVIILSLPINGRNPEWLVMVDEYGEVQDSLFNPITETIDGRIQGDGTFSLR